MNSCKRTSSGQRRTGHGHGSGIGCGSPLVKSTPGSTFASALSGFLCCSPTRSMWLQYFKSQYSRDFETVAGHTSAVRTETIFSSRCVGWIVLSLLFLMSIRDLRCLRLLIQHSASMTESGDDFVQAESKRFCVGGGAALLRQQSRWQRCEPTYSSTDFSSCDRGKSRCMAPERSLHMVQQRRSKYLLCLCFNADHRLSSFQYLCKAKCTSHKSVRSISTSHVLNFPILPLRHSICDARLDFNSIY